MQPSRSPERTGGRVRKTSLGGSTANRSPTAYTSRTTGASSSAAAISSSRRIQYSGGDDRLILDIGTRVTKVGHSNEARPRAVFWSLRHATPIDRPLDPVCKGMLWDADIARCKDDVERKRMEYNLRARLKHLLRSIFYQTLTHDPKNRKVVIVQNTFMPTLVQDILQDLLFSNLKVASVSFVPSHLMSAISIGRICAMVLDMGYEQTSLVPIHLWRPLTPRFLFISPNSAQRLSKRLKAFLLHFATYTPPRSSSTGSSFTTMHANSAVPGDRRIPIEILDEELLDEIKAKALTVGGPLRQNERPTLTSSKIDWKQQKPFGTIPEEEDQGWMNFLQERYEREKCSTKEMIFEIPPTPLPPLTPATQPATLSYSANPQPVRQGRGLIKIPGWVRERAIEILFEQGDEEELSLTEMVLNALLKLPIDVRQVMANNIYLTGGTAMIPGLAHRLRLELIETIRSAEMQSLETGLSVVSLDRPSMGARLNKSLKTKLIDRSIPDGEKRVEKPSTATSVSAGVDESFMSAKPDVADETFVTTQEGEEEQEAIPDSKRRMNYLIKYTPLIPLIQHIAVVNDHAPRLDTKGVSVSGQAPSFPVNTVAWTGASLITSLRIDSFHQTFREEYEEAQAELERKRKEAEGQSPSKTGKETGERPGMGLGRGSFLGTVGGLDLGTYGPLSAGARNRFSTGPSNSSNPNPRSPPGSSIKSPPRM